MDCLSNQTAETTGEIQNVITLSTKQKQNKKDLLSDHTIVRECALIIYEMEDRCLEIVADDVKNLFRVPIIDALTMLSTI